MKYLLPLIWLIIHLTLNSRQLGYTLHSPLYTHLTYAFAHAGLFHLIINTVSYISLYNALKGGKIICSSLIISFASAAAASFLSAYQLPTVGASGLIFAMLGCHTATVALNRKQWKQYSIILLLTLIVPFFIPRVNALLHLLSFTSAALITTIKSKIKNPLKPQSPNSP
ncbi:MAG: rhomboid family intramembrane serine protease [Tannerella sp.]|jgi:membrane associated rhomboid family serine protease|nr:rhomboid family intramembrane serine protease [Tannerella sp.]